MRMWQIFDYTELMLMVGTEFGHVSTSMVHTSEGRFLCASKSRYAPRDLASKHVLRLRVSSYSDSRHAKNEDSGFHLYFHSEKLPVHIALHPTDTRNNFHLSFSDESVKAAFLKFFDGWSKVKGGKGKGGKSKPSFSSYSIPDFLGEDAHKGLVLTDEVVERIETEFVPFLAEHLDMDPAITHAHLHRFVDEFMKMMGVFYKNRRIREPDGTPKHHSILDLPFYPKDVRNYLAEKERSSIHSKD
jgi:hypothetical protein